MTVGVKKLTDIQSNSPILADLKVDNEGVASLREKEATSEIPKTPKHVGRDGRKRGAKPKKPSAARENTEDQPVLKQDSDHEQPPLFNTAKKQSSTSPKTTRRGKDPCRLWSCLHFLLGCIKSCCSELDDVIAREPANRSPSLIEPIIQRLKEGILKAVVLIDEEVD